VFYNHVFIFLHARTYVYFVCQMIMYFYARSNQTCSERVCVARTSRWYCNGQDHPGLGIEITSWHARKGRRYVDHETKQQHSAPFHTRLYCVIKIRKVLYRTGVRGGVVGWGTALQAGRFPGPIPDGVVGIFHCHNPSGHTMVLGSTQPLTEMSTRNISWGLKAVST
jgi:hypothetical protein